MHPPLLHTSLCFGKVPDGGWRNIPIFTNDLVERLNETCPKTLALGIYPITSFLKDRNREWERLKNRCL